MSHSSAKIAHQAIRLFAMVDQRFIPNQAIGEVHHKAIILLNVDAFFYKRQLLIITLYNGLKVSVDFAIKKKNRVKLFE